VTRAIAECAISPVSQIIANPFGLSWAEKPLVPARQQERLMAFSNHSGLSGFLARLLIRSALSNEECEAVLRLPSPARHVRPNYDIIAPGQTVDHACLVTHGIVARYDQMRNGRRQITALHIAGDMCDLHSVVCPTAAWGLNAMTAVTIVNVPHRELRKLAVTYPNIALAFWRDSTADASILAKWVGNIGRRNARARMAHLLCEMALRVEKAGLGTRTSFWLEVTQQNLADALGLTAVHVNRTMQALRSEGLIHVESRTVNIVDWDRLCELAEFDPAYLLLQPLAK
jgi:CRP-like cAMP-binding protein